MAANFSKVAGVSPVNYSTMVGTPWQFLEFLPITWQYVMQTHSIGYNHAQILFQKIFSRPETLVRLIKIILFKLSHMSIITRRIKKWPKIYLDDIFKTIKQTNVQEMLNIILTNYNYLKI